MSEKKLVYMTAENQEEAHSIASVLIAEKLAACVNIFADMNAVFMWKGEVQKEKETAFVAKTTADRIPDLIRRVKEVHSYECPCIVNLPIDGGNPEFLDWIESEIG
jgi:periplasmic divalent cation tolerance protein